MAEWPGKIQGLDRDPSRQSACGAPVFAKFSYDDQFLYMAATVTMFDGAQLSSGAACGKDDGVEICLAGKTVDGQPATFVVRGYASGAVKSAADGGAPQETAARLAKEVRFAAKTSTAPAGKRKAGAANGRFPSRRWV